MLLSTEIDGDLIYFCRLYTLLTQITVRCSRVKYFMFS